MEAKLQKASFHSKRIPVQVRIRICLRGVAVSFRVDGRKNQRPKNLMALSLYDVKCIDKILKLWNNVLRLVYWLHCFRFLWTSVNKFFLIQTVWIPWIIYNIFFLLFCIAFETVQKYCFYFSVSGGSLLQSQQEVAGDEPGTTTPHNTTQFIIA